MATEAIVWEQIVDANWDQAIYTAAPNATINVAQFAAAGSGTNIGIALTPKGTGYISAHVPDGTTAGGNARGAKSIDLQMSRTAADQVAAAAGDVVIGTNNKTIVSGAFRNVVIGVSNSVVNGYESHIFGRSNNSASPWNTLIGVSNYADSSNNCIFGESCLSANGAFWATVIGRFSEARYEPGQTVIGVNARGYLRYAHTRAATRFVANGDTQRVTVFGKLVTTNDTPSTMLWPENNIVIPANRVWSGILQITGINSTGTKVATYERKVTLKRVVNTSTLVDSQVVGTDIPDGTAIAVSVNDDTDALVTAITGITGETWRWMGTFTFHDLLAGS